MIQSDFVPQLMATQLPTGTRWFMQDDAPPHTDNFVLDFLNNIFGLHLTSHSYLERHNYEQLWPPLSLDLIAYGLFVCGVPAGEGVLNETSQRYGNRSNYCPVVQRDLRKCHHKYASSVSRSCQTKWRSYWRSANSEQKLFSLNSKVFRF
jgi:hypothetical protein